jgi:deoxyuridine 5'-triphosphate nucleotidohydrolase
MSITVYLAQPIDFGSADTSLVLGAEGEMAAMDWTIYDPKSAFTVGATPHGAVSRINQAAMDEATGGVAFLPSGAKTVGVPAEIGYLTARFKPVLLVTDMGQSSWAVAGWADSDNVKAVPMTADDVSAGLDWLRDRMSLLATQQPEPIVFEARETGATLPTKGYNDDAGYDLYAAEDAVIPARGQGVVSCGVSVDIPEGMWAQITGRSSTLKNHNLLVAPTVGVIDEGYTGELFAPVVSISDDDVKITRGQRIAQLILHHAPGQDFQPVWGQVRSKARGDRGFGSTGR